MIFGWDISTSIVGVAVLDEKTGRLLKSAHVDLRKVVGFFEKAKAVAKFISLFVPAFSSGPNVHFVEEKLGNFTAGKSMMQTLMVLASFNAVVSWILFERGDRVVHIHPSTVKSIMRSQGLIVPKGADKKKLTMEFVDRTEKEFVVDLNKKQNPQPWCFDRADAYCVARSGFVRGYLSKDEQNQEDRGPKSIPG